MSNIRVIVAGSRDFQDYFVLSKTLESILSKKSPQNVEIVSGTARGADKMGERYAIAHGCKVKRMPADWDLYGKSAGYRRNEEMAEYATHAVIYWDEKSKGTKHMIDLAVKHGLTHIVLNLKGELIV